MPIETVRQLCVPNKIVTSDTLSEQVAQLEDFGSGRIDGREFFRRNHFTAGLDLLVRLGFKRLAGDPEAEGAYYLTQAMGGGKTHSLIALGLLATDPVLRQEVMPKIAAGKQFDAAKVVIFSGHQSPETLLWGFIAEKLGREVMVPFWKNGARTLGIDEWVATLGDEPTLILLDELPSYLQMAQGEPVGGTTLGELTGSRPASRELFAPDSMAWLSAGPASGGCIAAQFPRDRRRGLAERPNIAAGMPPASQNHRIPTTCDTPVANAASSLAMPMAIAVQNRCRSSRPAPPRGGKFASLPTPTAPLSRSRSALLPANGSCSFRCGDQRRMTVILRSDLSPPGQAADRRETPRN